MICSDATSYKFIKSSPNSRKILPLHKGYYKNIHIKKSQI